MAESRRKIGLVTWVAGIVVGSILVAAVGLWLEPIVSEDPTQQRLKTIQSADGVWRRDGDGTLDYGKLTELQGQELVDSVLSAGTISGGTTFSTSRPAQVSDKYFATNMEGVVYYTTSAVSSARQPNPRGR